MQTIEAGILPLENRTPPGPPAGRLSRYLVRLEDGLLVVSLLGMLGFAVLQIVLRTFFHSGIVWADGFVRLLVLWVGLLGAVSASRDDNHIRIDLVTRYMPPRLKTAAGALVQLATAVICGLVAWFGWKFVGIEFEYNAKAFSEVPSWICELIIPLGFAVISFRYLVLSINQFKTVVTTTPP